MWQLSCLLLAVFSLAVSIPASSTTCEIPDEFRGTWFLKYSPVNRIELSTVGDKSFSLSLEGVQYANFTCREQANLAPLTHHVFDTDITPSDWCFLTLRVGQVLFTVPFDTSLNDPDVSICNAPSMPRNPNALVQYPFSFEPGNCDLPEGYFDTVVGVGSGPDSCYDSPSSTISINGDFITTSTCLTGSSYENPQHNDLQCLTRVNPGIFQPGAAGGDILILASLIDGVTRIYCARFSTDLSTQTAYLSLDYNGLQEPICALNATSKDNKIRFTLSSKQCDHRPCLNGAECVQEFGSYTCVCPPGFVGAHCEIQPDDCLGNVCQHGGTCVDGVDSYACTCPDDYSGKYCQDPVCTPDSCSNNGVCSVNSQNVRVCDCIHGFIGETCEINVDECASASCQNGGQCVDGVNMYSCTCDDGFIGQNCEYADPCLSSPCEEQQTCTVDRNGHYECLGPKSPKAFPWVPIIITASVVVFVILVLLLTYCLKCRRWNNDGMTSSLSDDATTYAKASSTENRKVTVSISMPQKGTSAPSAQKPLRLYPIKLAPRQSSVVIQDVTPAANTASMVTAPVTVTTLPRRLALTS